MKLTKSQIKRIIREEMSRVSDSQIEIDVSSLIREQAEDLDEGLFTQALKTAAINMVPGGRIAADFTRARGFEALEEAAEAMEERVDSLEQRVQAIESMISSS
jgi:hypothetical protein|tara:strand:- start:13363 stop:13671 length:309 start_codon:yes stop_codon:yes gene_type:complete